MIDSNLEAMCSVDSIHSSFIHIEHLYSASSRKLLGGAPSSRRLVLLRVRRKRSWQSSRKKRKFRRKAIPGRRAHHGECTVNARWMHGSA